MKGSGIAYWPNMSDVAAAEQTYLDLDGAWGSDPIPGLRRLDATSWGAPLRYCAPSRLAESFWRHVEPQLGKFVLYGSGDYHYLAGFFTREAIKRAKSLAIVSFDNHPDWDVRPPRWSCGGWLSRTLKDQRIGAASVWGCGNFELRWPSRVFADKKALESGRLSIHAWAERQPPAIQDRFKCMDAGGWKKRFEHFAELMSGQDVYVTVDIDCLRKEEAVTNWENGLFTAADVAWAIDRLKRSARGIAGGDVCGAHSPARYARVRQRLAGTWDHPRIARPDASEALARNLAALRQIWPVLTSTPRLAASRNGSSPEPAIGTVAQVRGRLPV